MNDRDERIPVNGIDRRRFMASIGVGATAGLSGCNQQRDPRNDTLQTEPSVQDPPRETPASDPVPEGGKPTIGFAIAPTTLNPLLARSAYEFYVIDRVYDSGVTNDPRDQSPRPWMFAEWSVDAGNAGTDDPTLRARLRDDLRFHDGEDLTAEDYRFTVEYISEQEPSASLTAAAHTKVDDVELVDEYTVDIYMSEPDHRWFANILGYPILPKHIWEEVDDFTRYDPRQSVEGLVGAGPWELVALDWGESFEFEPAYDEYPPARSADWISDGAPFIDGFRFETFDSQSALEHALRTGTVDAGFIAGGVTVWTALEILDDDGLTAHQSPAIDYHHISYNLRRTPFDDVAFRQFLNKLFDERWVVEELYGGVATPGNFVVSPALESWRPPDPREIAGDEYQADDRFDPISIPDLSFPGTAGTFDLDEDEIDAARAFLLDHVEARHEYHFDIATTDLTSAPDGLELYVDGDPFTLAHSDTNGRVGQGPISFDFQPPEEDVYQARYCQPMVALMRKVGIPTESRIRPLADQTQPIYVDQQFDMYAMGWSVGVNVTHLPTLYGSDGIDRIGADDRFQLNPMGYTGADALIDRDLALVTPERRMPVVRQVCAKIYHDAPTKVTHVADVIEPTNDRFEGWINGTGTVINGDSFLNLRQTE